MSDSEPVGNHAPRVLAAARRMPGFSFLFRRLDPHQQEVIAILRRTVIFADLTESELIELLHLLHERTFTAGETVFTEGEPGLGLYVIFHGEVEIGKGDRQGRGRLARLGPGEVFGEVSFLDGGARSATVTATARTELISFYRTEIMDLLQRKPLLASKILFALAGQISLRMRALLQMMDP